MHHQIINDGYIPLIKNIKKNFIDSTASIHKARNEIKIVRYNDADLVVKSFKVPNCINKIIYTFFKDSKAKKSYDNSLKIINFVPLPIGYVENTKFGLLHDSYFISEKFDYDFTIREALLNPDFFERETLFKEFARFTFNLHNLGVLHLDYSPGNILIKKDSTSYIFKIVDINRMQFKELTLDARVQNFSKLWAKDDDLIIIIKEYALLANYTEEICIAKALKYSQAHKDKKNFKKRLRGKKVVD